MHTKMRAASQGALVLSGQSWNRMKGGLNFAFLLSFQSNLVLGDTVLLWPAFLL